VTPGADRPREPEALASGGAPPPRRFRLLLEFDGTDFLGWQRQAAGERTVQATVEQALAKLPGEHSAVVSAGRTDAGVHALAMVAHFDSSTALADERLRLALNAHLPRDVVVLRVETCPSDFESQFHCRYRRYLYRMRLAREDPRGLALLRHRALSVFRELDVAAMQRAAAYLLGHHDFAAFATQESRTTARTVYLCELRWAGASAGGRELRLHIAADGFLRNMVRTIVGTLLWVGKGKLVPAEVEGILLSQDRKRAGQNVAAHGLYFVEAGYQAWDPSRSEAAVADLVL